MTPDKLTDEQVENWRRILLGAIGPYALLMTREQIQAHHDRVQAIWDTKVSVREKSAG